MADSIISFTSGSSSSGKKYFSRSHSIFVTPSMTVKSPHDDSRNKEDIGNIKHGGYPKLTPKTGSFLTWREPTFGSISMCAMLPVPLYSLNISVTIGLLTECNLTVAACNCVHKHKIASISFWSLTFAIRSHLNTCHSRSGKRARRRSCWEPIETVGKIVSVGRSQT